MAGATPWDLRRRGLKDAIRHDQRVREAIRQNLKHLIAEETIIASDGQKAIKVPVRYLDQYRFRYLHEDGGEGVGQGEGKPGDTVARRPVAGSGEGAGDQPGADVYETEITVDELAQMMLEDLGLPWLEEKPTHEVNAERLQFDEVRRHGILPNLDKRRTLFENLKRHAARGEARIGSFADDDLRYKVWDEVKAHQARAAVYLMLDRSGSMTTEKKYIAKSFFFWLVRFLRRKYHSVDLVFVAHDVNAQIVAEEAFFKVSNSGGTRCSSAYQVALDDIRVNHPPALWNNYVFHFSDGDNLPSDNERCVEQVRELLDLCRMVGYGEIAYRDWGAFYTANPGTQGPKSQLFQSFAGVEDPHFVRISIHRRDDLHAALEAFLRGEEEIADAG